MPTGRYGVAAAASNGKVYAIGGESLGFVIHAEVEAYDPSTDSWVSRASLSSARTEVAVTTGIDGKIYAIGGNLDGGQTGFRTVTTLEVYDPASNSWTIKQPMSVNRSLLFAATATNGKIYVMGGVQTNNQPPVSTVEECDPVTDSWTTKSNMPVGTYGASAVAASNGKIYIIGGGDLSQNFAAVYEDDPDTDTWVSRTSMPFARNSNGAIEGDDGKIYAFGATTGGGASSVDVYDPLTDIWTSGPVMPATRSRFGAAKAANGAIYVVGGTYNGSQSDTNRLEELR